MSSDKNYIVSFSFLVLFAFFALLLMLRNFMPSSNGIDRNEELSLEPVPSVSDPFTASGTAFQAPEVLASDPSIGPNEARVTIIQFSDFECPFCKVAHENVVEIQRTHADDVRVVWKDFPLPQHERARELAFAARCAGEQGKFWEFANRAFSAVNRQCVDEANGSCGDGVVVAQAIGLNMAAFRSCVDEGRYESIVGESINQGIRADIGGVPFLFVNGRTVAGNPTREQLEELVQQELNT